MVAVLRALAMLVVPALAGALVGGALRVVARPVAPRRVVSIALAIGVVALPFFAAADAPYSVYDLILAAVLFAASLIACASPVSLRAPPITNVLVALVGTGLGLIGLEIGCHFLPGAPPMDNHSVAELNYYFPREHHDFRCQILYSENMGEGRVNRHLRPVGPRDVHKRRYLHIGDSMLDASDVPMDDAFTEIVQRARPDEEHLNLATGGIGPDAYYLIARRWIPFLQPDEAIVHVFLGNDLHDMDGAYDCCDHGPLLDEPAAPRPDGIRVRCPRPRWSSPISQRFVDGPAPYPLRVFAHWSQLARRLARAFELVSHGQTKPWVYPDWAGTPEQVKKFQAVMYALRDEMAQAGVKLTVVLLPPRWTLELHNPPGDPFVPQHEEVRRILRDGGIRYFDSWDMLQQALDEDHGKSDIFNVSGPGNPHFGVAGHKLFAAWELANVLGH